MTVPNPAGERARPTSVTTKPAYGSVESFAEIIRQPYVHDDTGVYACLTGILQSVVDHDETPAERRVELVRNALAAAELVRAEIRAAGR